MFSLNWLLSDLTSLKTNVISNPWFKMSPYSNMRSYHINSTYKRIRICILLSYVMHGFYECYTYICIVWCAMWLYTYDYDELYMSLFVYTCLSYAILVICIYAYAHVYVLLNVCWCMYIFFIHRYIFIIVVLDSSSLVTTSRYAVTLCVAC